MASEPTFEVGKHYKTRDGRKATVLLILTGYMVGTVEKDAKPITWFAGGGAASEPYPKADDIVAEWREPARVMAYVYRNTRTGTVILNGDQYLGGHWELIAQREIVEGEGL